MLEFSELVFLVALAGTCAIARRYTLEGEDQGFRPDLVSHTTFVNESTHGLFECFALGYSVRRSVLGVTRWPGVGVPSLRMYSASARCCLVTAMIVRRQIFLCVRCGSSSLGVGSPLPISCSGFELCVREVHL